MSGNKRGFSPTSTVASISGAVALTVFPALLNGASGTATQTLSAQIDAVAELSVPATLSVASGGTIFAAYAGSLTVSYRARTTASTGSGSVTVKASADFSPSGGPSIASGALTYTCSSVTLGTACTGTQTTSTTSNTGVVTVGAGACTGGGGSCSSTNPNTAVAGFTLTDSPAFKTGSYSTTLTFTASAM